MNTIDIPFNNVPLRVRLDAFREEFFALREKYGVEDGISIKTQNDTSHSWYCEEDYLLDICSLPHAGFPERYYSINIPALAKEHPDIWMDYLDRLKNETATLLGAHTSALSLFYPPTGFVGWHTNENCSSYQILFTWSETGEGFFRYRDPITQDVVTLNDKPGWNVRAHYFGSADEPDYRFWHCAYTDCNRFSFAYKWVNGSINSLQDAQVKRMFLEAIDDIENG